MQQQWTMLLVSAGVLLMFYFGLYQEAQSSSSKTTVTTAANDDDGGGSQKGVCDASINKNDAAYYFDYFHRLEETNSMDCVRLTRDLTSINYTTANFPHSVIVQDDRWMTVQFQAYDRNNRSKSVGGDEFRVTLWSYTASHMETKKENRSLFKTAAVAEDLFNGLYRVTLPLPLQTFRITLHHWYTCYQGTARDLCVGTRFSFCREFSSSPNGTTTRTIPRMAFAPILTAPVETPTGRLKQLLTTASVKEDSCQKTTTMMNRDNLTLCEASQDGIELMTQNGIWFEKEKDQAETAATAAISTNEAQQQNQYSDTTLDAEWIPSCCRMEENVESLIQNKDFLRVGDSTLPLQSFQVGFPYQIVEHFYPQWIKFLLTSRSIHNSSSSSIMVFQAGLHQLFLGFRASELVEIVLLMLCQMASIFRGKIVILGPNPVQQHLYPTADIRDGEVRIANALLRERIVKNHGGNLLNICRSVKVDLATLVLVPNWTDGSISTDVSYNRALELELIRQPLIQRSDMTGLLGLACGKPTCYNSDLEDRFNSSLLKNFTTLYDTPMEEQLLQQLREVDYEASFANRTVWFTDLHSFLLPRDDMYRENDKLHDLGKDGKFFLGPHAQMVQRLATLRSKAGV